MDTILITGVAGFIGSAVAELFITRGYKIIGIDNLSTGTNIKVNSGVVFIEGDLAEDSTFSKIPDTDISTIIHIAGQSGGIPSWEDNINDFKSNAMAGLKLINFAISRNIKKFVYTSSMAVYGNPLNQPVLENSIADPLTPYAISKLIVEQYLKIYSDKFNKIHILRLNNTYGPGQLFNNTKQGMVRIFLSQAFENKKISVQGSIDRYRDFVYIDDVTNAIYLSYLSNNEEFQVMNIANNTKTTVRELLFYITKILPFTVEINLIDYGTRGDQSGIFCDISRAKSVLNWSPQIPLEYGLEKTVSDYLDSVKKL